jgi:hypothetical protein
MMSCCFLLGAWGCAPGLAAPQEVYSPSSVHANIRALEGRRVHVKGYLVRSDEGHAIFDSKEAMERTGTPGYRPEEHCITFYHDDHGARAVGRRPNSTIEVVGTIGVNRSTTEVDLWACSDTFITVHDVIDRPMP